MHLFKKLSAALICMIFVLGCLPACTAQQQSAFDWSVYREENKALTLSYDEPQDGALFSFAMLSDIHLQIEDEDAEQNFRSAVGICRELGGSLNAVAVAGDFLDPIWYNTLGYEDTTIRQNNLSRDKEIDYLLGVFDEVIPDNTKLVYSLGNHDMTAFRDWNGVEYVNATSSAHYYNAFKNSPKNYFENHVDEDVSGTGLTQEQLSQWGLNYTRFDCCHFITCDVQRYWREADAYDEEQIAWVDGTMEYISENYPGQPIFFITHSPVQNTIMGSSGTSGTRDMHSVLVKYPQTVTFTGHIHYSCYSEKALSTEKGYACVECCSVKYTNNAVYDTGKRFDTANNPESYSSSMGLLVRVYEDNVRISRLDFTNHRKAGKDWVISRGGMRMQEQENQKPYFVSPKITGETRGGYLNVKFSPARDDELVLAYSVEATYDDGSQKSCLLDSGYSGPEMPYVYSSSFPEADRITGVTVTAIDSRYEESLPLTLDISAIAKEQDEAGKTTEFFGSLPGTIKIGDKIYKCAHSMKQHDVTLSNYKSMTARAVAYFPAYANSYEFSFKITDMMLNKAWTCNGYAYADYRTGMCLAAFEYNGKIFSINASLFFSHTSSDGKVRYRDEVLDYYVLITDSNNPSYSEKYSLTDYGFTPVDLPMDLLSELHTGEGATLKAVRQGTRFMIYLNGSLLDEVNFDKPLLLGSRLMYIGQNTKSAFGISTLGAEATYSDFDFKA